MIMRSVRIKIIFVITFFYQSTFLIGCNVSNDLNLNSNEQILNDSLEYQEFLSDFPKTFGEFSKIYGYKGPKYDQYVDAIFKPTLCVKR